MSDLYTVAGSFTYSNLLASPEGADVISIPCTPGQGTIPMGTVMYRDSSTGLYNAAANGQISTSYALVVLAEDVATGSATSAVAEDAKAYRAGIFIDGAVILASNGTLSAANKVVLGYSGIRFDKKQSTDTVANGTVTITYKPNNSVSADSDYAAVVAKGSAYTILGNTTTDFTAPTGKSFSKWNTKSDGTGTDYAAAASYTASADLTLYAVWA